MFGLPVFWLRVRLVEVLLVLETCHSCWIGYLLFYLLRSITWSVSKLYTGMHDLNNFTSNQSYIGKSWTWGLAYRWEVGLLKMTREMTDRVGNFTLVTDHRQTMLTHKECDILQTRGTRESSVMWFVPNNQLTTFSEELIPHLENIGHISSEYENLVINVNHPLPKVLIYK